MQQAKLLIPLLHSPMAEEQCHASRGGWDRERQQQRRKTGHWTSLSSLPWPTTAHSHEHSVAAHTFSMYDASATEGLPVNSTMAPQPVPKQARLEGSITAKCSRGCSCALNLQQHMGPFPPSDVRLILQGCTDYGIWTPPAMCRCMVTQMCWLLNTGELRHVASCSKGLWKTRIHCIYSQDKIIPCQDVP